MMATECGAQPHSCEDALTALLAGGGIRVHYQPIVDLETGQAVGYEALARGPVAGPLATPERLFDTARASGRLAELDRTCQRAALAGARAAGLADPWVLFVNCEPEVWEAGFLLEDAAPGLQVVVELTERALTARPAALLQSVERVRARGWGIALDDVGADPASLALIPLVRPDVIKLDLRLAQAKASAHVAEVVTAVAAEAERSGALVLAEGIETAEHLLSARASGATLGQGWLFGRPGPLPRPGAPTPRTTLQLPDRAPLAPGGSAFAVVTAHRPARTGPKSLLLEMSKHLERQALNSGESGVVVSSFQDAHFFISATRARYQDLAAQLTFVGALGSEMPTEPAPGVRGGILGPGDKLRNEWVVSVLGPHFAGSLVARDLSDRGPDRDRRFRVVVTYDRSLVVEVATALMSRIAPHRANDKPQPRRQAQD